MKTYTPSIEVKKEIENRFTYHAPTDGQPEKYEAIRVACKTTAQVLVTLCPPSRELSLALTHLQETTMWANAAIACDE